MEFTPAEKELLKKARGSLVEQRVMCWVLPLLDRCLERDPDAIHGRIVGARRAP